MQNDTPTVYYLFSQFPTPSQTFCVREMIGLERAGSQIRVISINAPKSELRHAILDELDAPCIYPPTKKRYAKFKKELYLQHRKLVDKLIARFEKNFSGSGIAVKNRVLNAIYFGKLILAAERNKQELGGNCLIHVHFANQATITAYFIKKIFGIPYTFTAHGQDYMSDLPLPLTGELIAEAAKVINVSSYGTRQLQCYFPKFAAKIHPLHNSIFIEKNEGAKNLPARKDEVTLGKRLKKDDEILILHVGRLVGFKGVDVLIKAYAVAKRHCPNLRLAIIGEGELEKTLQELAAKIAPDTEFLGLRSQREVKFCLARADIFALATKVGANGATDNLPTVIIEAALQKTPIASCRLAGVAEIIPSAKHGLLCDFNNPNSFAKIITRLANDAKLRQSLAKNAYNFVSLNFQPNKIIPRLREIQKAAAEKLVLKAEKFTSEDFREIELEVEEDGAFTLRKAESGQAFLSQGDEKSRLHQKLAQKHITFDAMPLMKILQESPEKSEFIAKTAFLDSAIAFFQIKIIHCQITHKNARIILPVFKNLRSLLKTRIICHVSFWDKLRLDKKSADILRELRRG